MKLSAAIVLAGLLTTGVTGDEKGSGAPSTTTFDPANKGPDVTLSNGNLTAAVANTLNDYEPGRSITSHSSGKYYFECTWSSLTTPATAALGVANSSASLVGVPGFDANLSIVVFGSASGWNINSTIGDASTTWVQGDVVGIAVDTTAKLIWQVVMHAGTVSNWNASGTANPATGTGGQSISAITGPYYAVCYGDSANPSPPTYTGKFGASTYQIVTNGGSVPSGFGNY